MRSGLPAVCVRACVRACVCVCLFVIRYNFTASADGRACCSKIQLRLSHTLVIIQHNSLHTDQL